MVITVVAGVIGVVAGAIGVAAGAISAVGVTGDPAKAVRRRISPFKMQPYGS